jgi:hypothetical protein
MVELARWSLAGGTGTRVEPTALPPVACRLTDVSCSTERPYLDDAGLLYRSAPALKALALVLTVMAEHY